MAAGNKKLIYIGAIVAAAAAVGIAVAAVSMTDPAAETPPDVPFTPDADDAATETATPTSLVGDVMIGLILPLTGDLSSHGEENHEGSKLAVDDFNAYLEEQGEEWRLVMTSEDSATSPAVALEKLTSLNAKGIGVVVGPETSSNIRNIKGYADANNMLLVSCCSTAPSLAVADDSVYRLVPDDSNQGTAVAKLLREDGIEMYVPVWRADAWGEGLIASTRASFEDRGGQSVEGFAYDPEAPEFSAAASLLAAEVEEHVEEFGADKVAVHMVGFAETVQLMQSASNHDVLDDVAWYGSDGSVKEDRIVSDAIGSEFASTVHFTAMQPGSPSNPTYARVEAHVQDVLGRSPSTYVHTSYDAVWLVGLAMMEAGSSDVDAIKEVMHGVADEYVGATGDIKLNEAGDLASADYEIWAVEDGEWARMGTYFLATDELDLEPPMEEGMMEEGMMEEGMMDGTMMSGDVRIGLILPLTGDLSSHGEENHEGSKLAVDDFNAYLEEQGEEWRLVMTSEDSATSPAVALEKLTSLNAKGIGVVVGPETSSNIRNIKGYADANNMLLVSCCSTAPSLAVADDSVYRLVPDDSNQGTAVAKLLREDGIEMYVPVWRADAWGEGLIASTRASFEDRGGQSVEGFAYDPEAPEFSAAASLLAAEVEEHVEEFGADKVAVHMVGFAETVQLMQSASNHDILDDVAWYGSDGSVKEDRIVSDAIGSEFASTVHFTAMQPGSPSNPTYARVEAHVQDVLGRSPSTYVHTSYDAVWLVGLAMMEAGSSDVDAIKEVMHGVADEYVGATGDIKLNEAGDLASADYEIWAVEDGEWARMGTYFLATDELDLEPPMEEGMMEEGMMEEGMMEEGMMEEGMMEEGMMEEGMMEEGMMDGTMMSGDVRIGLILPLTGDLSSHGEENHEGSKLAVDDFNAYLEEQGEEWRLVMTSEDSATSPAVALEKLTSLNAKGIGVVVGPETSSNIRNIKGYADANNMLLVSCCSTAPSLAVADDSVYRLVPDDSNQGTAVAKLLREDGIEMYVPVWRADAWGEGLIASTRASFEDRGGQSVEGFAYDPEAPEFSAAASLLAAEVNRQVREFGADKVAVHMVGFAETVQLMQSASNHDVLDDVAWYGSDGSVKEDRIVSDAIGSEFASTVHFTAMQPGSPSNPTYARVEAHVQDVLGRSPSTYVHTSYDAVWLVGLAMMEAGSSDVDAIKEVMHGVADEYVGATGDIKLNEAGDLASADYEIWAVEDGEWARMGTYFLATDELDLEPPMEEGMMDGTMMSGDVRIGLILPLTGDLSSHGEENHEGSKLAVDDFNAYLEEQGEEWRLVMTSEDSATSPAVALEKLTSLNAKGIGVVVGPETSSNIRNIKGYADANNMLLVSCCSTAPSLAVADDSVYRLVPDDSNQGTAVAKLLREDGIEMYVPVWRADAWGEGLIASTRASFEDRGGQSVEGFAYDPEAPEFSAAASLLAAEVEEHVEEFGADKVAVHMVGFAETVQLMQSASNHDVLDDVAWYGSDGSVKEDRIVSDAIGSEFASTVHFTAMQPGSPSNPTYARVEAHVQDVLGRSPSTYVHTSYDAVWLVGLAMMEAGSSDVDAIKEVMHGVADEYVGATGDIKLNEAGDLASADYEIWAVEDGEWARMGTYFLATDELDLS